MSYRLNRRTLLKSGAVAVAGVAATCHHPAAAEGEVTEGRYLEPARALPLVERDDVIVCGAGPAGVAAAIAAARTGARTRLLEVHGCLGGVWTAGLLSWILDAGTKTGLMRAIAAELRRRNASVTYPSAIAYDVEQMKLLLEEMCLQAGVKIRLHTRVVGAARDKSNRLSHVITESKSGREAWSAAAFVDATGDGDLAAQAGCQFDCGAPASGEVQPMSMIALLTGIKFDEVAALVTGPAGSRDKPSAKERLLAELQRAGVSPSYAQPTLFYLHKDLFCLMANHEYHVSATDAEQITTATLRGRAEVNRLVNALRSLGGGWQNIQLIATAAQIGVREGRRIRGLYQVTAGDLLQGAKHEDAVCQVRFSVDIHSPDPAQSKGIVTDRPRVKPYDIPYRALIARDVDGLLMAGRCISGDFLAHASYRVTGNAVPMGEAAGVGAALAATTGRLPQEVPWAKIRAALPTASETSDKAS